MLTYRFFKWLFACGDTEQEKLNKPIKPVAVDVFPWRFNAFCPSCKTIIISGSRADIYRVNTRCGNCKQMLDWSKFDLANIKT